VRSSTHRCSRNPRAQYVSPPRFSCVSSGSDRSALPLSPLFATSSSSSNPTLSANLRQALAALAASVGRPRHMLATLAASVGRPRHMLATLAALVGRPRQSFTRRLSSEAASEASACEGGPQVLQLPAACSDELPSYFEALRASSTPKGLAIRLATALLSMGACQTHLGALSTCSAA
jgi:hypothetical protein